MVLFAFGAIGFGAQAQAVKVLPNGNVGIGFDEPTQKLHVVGNSFLDGNVGIGRITPAFKLDVDGNGRFGTANGNGVIVGTYTCGCGYTRAAVYSNDNSYKLYLFSGMANEDIINLIDSLSYNLIK